MPRTTGAQCVYDRIIAETVEQIVLRLGLDNLAIHEFMDVHEALSEIVAASLDHALHACIKAREEGEATPRTLNRQKKALRLNCRRARSQLERLDQVIAELSSLRGDLQTRHDRLIASLLLGQKVSPSGCRDGEPARTGVVVAFRDGQCEVEFDDGVERIDVQHLRPVDDAFRTFLEDAFAGE